jgi:Enoyl-CoA hydratase/carnithine racemase
MSSEEILIEREESMGLIFLNREQKLNALNNKMQETLYNVISEMNEEDSIRVIIVSGKGRAFSAGSDIYEYIKWKSESNLLEFIKHQRLANRLFELIEDIEKPVIAAVNGYALGGGFELALACDFIIASKEAEFGFPEIKLGLIPGGGFRKLLLYIGPNRTKEFLLTGKTIKADELMELGIVNKVVEKDKLIIEAKNFARNIIGAWISVEKVKSILNSTVNNAFGLRNSWEWDVTSMLFNTQDAKEGLEAFLSKRPPKFTGK